MRQLRSFVSAPFFMAFLDKRSLSEDRIPPILERDRSPSPSPPRDRQSNRSPRHRNRARDRDRERLLPRSNTSALLRTQSQVHPSASRTRDDKFFSGREAIDLNRSRSELPQKALSMVHDDRYDRDLRSRQSRDPSPKRRRDFPSRSHTDYPVPFRSSGGGDASVGADTLGEVDEKERLMRAREERAHSSRAYASRSLAPPRRARTSRDHDRERDRDRDRDSHRSSRRSGRDGGGGGSRETRSQRSQHHHPSAHSQHHSLLNLDPLESDAMFSMLEDRHAFKSAHGSAAGNVILIMPVSILIPFLCI